MIDVEKLPTDEELLEAVGALIAALENQLAETLPSPEKRPGGKLVGILKAWKEAVLYRAVDLGSNATETFGRGLLIPGCTLTRALFETAAVLHLGTKKLRGFIKDRDFQSIDEFARRSTFGSKDGSSQEEALQVLTAISHLDKAFPGTESEYFHLCEYAHPNLKGTLGTYSDFRKPEMSAVFGWNPQNLKMGPFGLGALEIILTLFAALLTEYTNAMNEFEAVVFASAPGVLED